MPSLSTCCHSAVCCKRVLGLLLAPLEVGGQPLALAPGSLIDDSSVSTVERQMLGGRTHFGEHLVADPVVLAAEHLLAEELDDRREVRLLVEFLVVHLDRVAAQDRRHRE